MLPAHLDVSAFVTWSQEDQESKATLGCMVILCQNKQREGMGREGGGGRGGGGKRGGGEEGGRTGGDLQGSEPPVKKTLTLL